VDDDYVHRLRELGALGGSDDAYEERDVRVAALLHMWERAGLSAPAILAAVDAGTLYRPSQLLQRRPYPFDEDLDVGAAVPVRDHGEVELPGVGERPDAQGQVPHDRDHREHLEQWRSLRYSGTGGPGTLATYMIMNRWRAACRTKASWMTPLRSSNLVVLGGPVPSDVHRSSSRRERRVTKGEDADVRPGGVSSRCHCACPSVPYPSEEASRCDRDAILVLQDRFGVRDRGLAGRGRGQRSAPGRP
jgi:hypothetical protein